MRVNKSLFTQAMLSTVFCLFSMPGSLYAFAPTNLTAAANGQSTGAAGYTNLNDGYNFVDNNITFTIQDNDNLGNNNIFSVDNNNGNNGGFCSGTACTGSILKRYYYYQ